MLSMKNVYTFHNKMILARANENSKIYKNDKIVATKL